MKKLMIAAAIVCAAAFAQAATYNWQAAADCVTTDGSGYETYLGASSVYFFAGDATTKATVMAALTGGDLTALDAAIASTTLGEGDYGYFMLDNTFPGASQFPAADGAASINGFLVFLDNPVPASAANAFASAVVTVELNDAIKGGGSASFNFGAIETNPSDWQSVPEPTSGLLLLIGVAGLALRRRRA